MAKARVKNRPRYANGRVKAIPRAIKEDEVKGVVLAYRQKNLGAPGVDAAKDHRYGSVLGVLCLQKVISQIQYEAGEEYGKRRAHFLGIMVEQNPNPASPGFAMVSRGLPCTPEPDDEVSIRRRRKHDDMMREIDELERLEGTTERYFSLKDLLDRAAVYNLEIAQTPANIGSLRAALNVLAKFFRMER